MKTSVNNEFIEINFKNRIYKVETRKVLYVINKLLNKTLDSLSESQILNLLDELKLIEPTFLENVNKL